MNVDIVAESLRPTRRSISEDSYAKTAAGIVKGGPAESSGRPRRITYRQAPGPRSPPVNTAHAPTLQESDPLDPVNDPRHPFGLPSGSVRGLMSLLISGF